VSDAPQGSGWWQASDGRWYPPESHPGPWVREPEAPPGSSPFGTGQPGIPVPPHVEGEHQPGITRPLEWAVVIGGAVLITIGSVLPWATLPLPFLGGEFSVNGTEGDGMFTLIIGFVVILFGIVGLNGRLGLGMTIASLIGATLALVTGIIDVTHMSRISSDAGEGAGLVNPSPGVGLILVLIGAAVSIIGAAILLVRR
jgi:hypothetical protein